MKFTKTKIDGVYIIDLERKEDERGFFARAFCVNEFKEIELETDFVQTNLSFNHKKGTIRGMHYQLVPNQEVKVMRTIKGKTYNVIVDMRKESETYMQWFGIELSAENRKMLYVPKGCANGYQALEDGTESLYSTTNFYAPESEKGIRYCDPKIGIKWPITEDIIVSEKDGKMPLL